MGLWAKVKGVFGRIGSGIKNVASKVWENRDKIADVANAVLPEQYRGAVNTGMRYLNTGHDVMQRLGI